MGTHYLKIKPEYFDLVKSNLKRYEIRKDDRDFKVGDIVVLLEFDGKSFTGGILEFTIDHILRDCPQFGLKKGFAILNINPTNTSPPSTTKNL